MVLQQPWSVHATWLSAGLIYRDFHIDSEGSHKDVRLPVPCSYSDVCSKVEEEWPVYQAVAYELQHYVVPVLEVQSFPD